MIEIRHRQDSERQGQRKAESKVERFQSSLSDASDDVVATDDKSPTSEQLKFETYDLKPRGIFRISDSVPNHGWHIKWVVSEITKVHSVSKLEGTMLSRELLDYWLRLSTASKTRK